MPTAITSKPKQQLFESFACPDDLAGEHDINPAEQGQLISLLEFPEFDFESPSSSDESTAIGNCRSLLAKPDQAEAIKLWERLCSIADDYRTADGGTLDLRALLAQLQGFQLQEHPLYRRDWQLLIENGRDAIESVTDTVGGIHIARSGLLADIENRVNGSRCVAVVGPSGCGKSAAVKDYAKACSAQQAVLWWHASVFRGAGDYAGFESGLMLHHRLRAILQSVSSSMPILVLDGIDRIYDDEAFRAMAALIRNLDLQNSQSPWRLIVTCQSEEWDRVRKRLAEVNLGMLAWRILPVGDFQPDNDDLSPVWEQCPSLRSIFLQERLRPVLCKPIVLSALAMNAAELQDDMTSRWIGESDIIDWFWSSVVRRRQPEAVRSEMMMVLGEKQADRLEHDVPEAELLGIEHLADMRQDGLCVSRPNDRVTFSHDTYGDWARLRRLVQLGPDALSLVRQNLESPMWNRAIRLYGLRLVERDSDLTQWQLAFDGLRSEDGADSLGQQLLLDSAVLATNALQILERLHPVLLADQGRLLLTLLRRFLHIATLPDPRMQAIAKQEGRDTHEAAANYRIPNWSLWPAMIRFLYNHREEVVAVVAGTVSDIADKWLRETHSGFPLRAEAAELGVLIAERVLHCEPIVGTQVGDFKSGLAAAPEFPERVAAFALEAAGRIQSASGECRGLGVRRRRRSDASTEPWTDGPRTDIDTDFQEQCLSPSNAGALNPLIDANPTVAREVILALLISLRRERNSIYDHSLVLHDQLEIEDIHRYFPPIYFRGPFLYFLRAHPDEGLELIIRLVDFVTDRWADQFTLQGAASPSLALDLPDRHASWIGDYYVHQWYQMQGHAPDPVICALMALEKWLYEKADAGEPLDHVISSIHARSHSLALIGVLCALGRRNPELFAGPLLPYLAVPELHHWEMTSTAQSSWLWAQMGWGMEQPGWIRKLADEWHNAPHRKHGMDQWAVKLFVTDDGVRNRLQPVVEIWKQQLRDSSGHGAVEWLEPLIPKFEMENYRETADANGNVYMVYEQPTELQRKYAPRLREIDEQNRLRDFVLRCRQVLDKQIILAEVDLEQFWQELQTVSVIRDLERPEPLLFSNRNARCAGAAVLIESHLGWLMGLPKRLKWCREQLVKSVTKPPVNLDGDMEWFAGDNLIWDRFCAEAMPTLWQQQPSSAELRRCVALLATGIHRNTIASLFWSAASHRRVLGDSFRQLQHLLLRYASVYLLRDRNSFHYNPDFDWRRWRQQHVDEFVDGRIPGDVPPWADIMQQEFVPSKRFAEAEALDAEFLGTPPRKQKPTLDTMFVSAAYSWLPELSVAIDEKERAEWIEFSTVPQ